MVLLELDYHLHPTKTKAEQWWYAIKIDYHLHPTKTKATQLWYSIKLDSSSY